MWRKVYINDEAFCEELCNKHFEQIYNYCKKLVKNQEQFMDIVEECAQDAFVEARKQISKLMNHPNIEGWLYVTARNLINNSYRTMYIRKRHEVFFDDNISRTLITDNDFERIFDGSIDVDKLSREILKKLTENEYELYTDYYLKYKQWRRAELKRRFSIKSAAMIAAGLILIFSITCTVANAFGYNLIQIAVHWGKETFNISAQRPSSMQEADNQNPGNISKSATYDSIEKAFEDIHPKPLLPGWLPDGFAFKYAEKFTRTEDTDILLYYGDSANRVIIFDFVVYKDSDETVRDTSFEKDDNLVQVYEKNNIKHYILKNIDQYQAVWSDSNVVYNINGDISTDEIKKIIDSMYGG